MANHTLLSASCRVALAAFLHDLGKFAERARIDEADSKDVEGNKEAEKNKALYCPKNQYGRYTHVHAAYTSMAVDLLESKGLLPPLKGQDVKPFASWKSQGADDSLINAAAMHHKPETFLQWIIATADRVASGFEREEFAEYNVAEDELSGKAGKKLNHYTTRQLTLMEQITLDESKRKSRHEEFDYCYALEALSPDALFPQKRAAFETAGNKEAQQQYNKLWSGFVDALEDIPASHRHDLALWLDHFETLWGTYTYAIPSATAGKTMPDVSLYDHSRTTAALAVALWRYHADQQHEEILIREQLRAQWDIRRDQQDSHQDAWADKKFLLIQGDFFGIQNFIFSAGSETQKRAAKLLRGRSFYISLLTECAALKVLDALDLPSTSQVINAAGKFLIVAPNTQKVLDKLKQVQVELDQWFLEHTYGLSGVGLAWLPASCNDFRKGTGEKAPFQQLIKRLFEKLELSKFQRMQLTEYAAVERSMVFSGFLDAFKNDQTVCAIDGRSPGTETLDKESDHFISKLAKDQITIGDALAKEKFNRLLIARDRSALHHDKDKLWLLKLPVFGYQVALTTNEEASGVFGKLAKASDLLRAFDFSLPESAGDALWNGYARRYINAYVPIVDQVDQDEDVLGKYDKVNENDKEQFRLGNIKTLSHIACDNRKLVSDKRWQGQAALMTLKGDVDDLGMIFQKGLGAPTFAKMAALSRQMNAFFAVYLPWLCRSDQGFSNVYTVFAGGDDFFLIGPWHSTMNLVSRMQQDFKRYVAHNEEVHFSAGLSMTKPNLPIRYLANMGEEALESAKAYPSTAEEKTKNAVSCFSQVMSWGDFEKMLENSVWLDEKQKQLEISRGYLYGLLNLVDMREKLDENPANALWCSYFSYRTYRMLERKRNLNDDQRKGYHEELAIKIANEGIQCSGGNYRVALFTHLYQQRD